MTFFSQRRSSLTYQLLDEKNEDEAISHAREPLPNRTHSFRSGYALLAVLSCILGGTTVILSVLLYRQQGITGKYSYEHGFATEIPAARSAIETVHIDFSGELLPDDEGRWMRKIDPTGPQYVGPPSDAIDHAWKGLVAPINIDLEGEETEGLPPTYIWPDSDRHYTGLTVHHSIHCLAIYREYYPFPDDPVKRQFTWIHLDHCLDFIRQVVQCHGDLTPMTWYWSEAINRTVLKPERAHTCRNWNKIQGWAMERVHKLTEEEKQRKPVEPTHGSWSP
ncbi:hypothetical protein NA57DRAFT_71898 [Rhizodiscina lignyota]|uniref:Tat pathway signal sequence n=1 Tax=Rhizodiscina lignyota TaxID=1504668 RepID=A0A9P4M9K5_9PEZI|nr:hypothetical protein NA57DRAFT_71898 [Rhizodiscina lignyota]